MTTTRKGSRALAATAPAAPALAEAAGAAGAGMTTGTQRAGQSAIRAAGAVSPAVQRLRDYVTLTKPRIISLLLVTTLAPMVVAAEGWPGVTLALATMVGGYLMAGGANTLNMFLDRDIDSRMTRTALRPIPSGRMSPAHGLTYGMTLAAAAFALFATRVNLASAWLAVAGFVYYVLIYTRWLKRRTPHNIVIGGGAGAFPPLVGWAAVTGDVSATALVLFLVVVLWTPPHFWALALVKQKEYGRASVPMAPNVWGEERTIRQMLGYTTVLVPATLVPVALGSVGWVYAVAAVGLGGWLARDVVRVARASDGRVPAAWAAYKTSLLYLALLFAAMVVDVLVRGV